MSYIPTETYRHACSVDLYRYLLDMHPAEVKREGHSLVLTRDKHVSLKQGYHGYMNFSKGDKGNNIDLLTRYLGYSKEEAADALTSYAGGPGSMDVHPGRYSPVPQAPEAREIVLPEPLDGPYRNLYAYLRNRGFPAIVIDSLVQDRLLYQSKKMNNLVFVSYEGDYCELRGTNTYADRRCKKRDTCPDFREGDRNWCAYMDTCPNYKPDPFHGTRKAASDRFWSFRPHKDKPVEVAYVCEAAIDAVSLYLIHLRYNFSTAAEYISIGGVANQAAIDRIAAAKKVILAVDNDEAGEKCRERNPALNHIIPINKDWNDDLRKGAFYGSDKH